jgi:hypothetical protein
MASPISYPESNSRLAVGMLILVGGLFALVAGGVCLVFSFLRETADFWRHSGGYPLWLRDLVKIGYYPLLVGDLCILMGLTTVLCARLKQGRDFLIFKGVLFCAAWALFWAAIGISANNNVTNFWHNRPIHHKSVVPR